MHFTRYVVYNKMPNNKGLCAFYSKQSIYPSFQTIYNVAHNSEFHFFKYQIQQLYKKIVVHRISTVNIVVSPLWQFKAEVHKISK